MNRLFAFAVSSLLLLACRSKAPSQTVTLASASVVSTARVDSSAVAAVVPPPCAFSGSYRGVVAGAPVLVRLARVGPQITGRYFYEKGGIDIALRGASTGDAFSLSEGESSKVTGTFEGRCDASGALAGQWKGAQGKTTAFSLVPIQPGKAVAATKNFLFRRKTKDQNPGPVADCTVKETWTELFGLEDAHVEESVNQQGLGVVHPRLRPQELKDARTCESGFEIEYSERIDPKPHDVASVVRTGYGMWDGAAHPNNFIDYAAYTLDLKTGKRSTAALVFAKDPTPIALHCFANGDDDSASYAANFSKEQFSIELTGIHFYGNGFGHAMSVATGQGPTVSFAILLRDGYLRKDSPFARLWETVKPAAKAAEQCLKEDWMPEGMR
jgi:hypothetical protein